MIDGETPDSNAATTSFLTIAAVPFDPMSANILPADHFYYRCSLDSLKESGFSVSQDTLDWWGKQSNEAFAEAFGGTKPIMHMFSAFHTYISILKESFGDVIVWGNGANFDNVICEHSFKKLGMSVPWSYKNNRCFRTLKELFPEIPIVYEGVKHNAVDDARNQALHAIKCLRALEAGKVK